MYANNVYTVEDDEKKDENSINNASNTDIDEDASFEEDYRIYDDDISYQDDEHVSSNNGFVIKLIIIILCVVVLIFLISALKKGKDSNNNEVHLENIEKVRLGSEKYFFLQNNIPSTKEVSVTLNTLINKGLVTEVVDANKKVCDGTQSSVTLNLDGNYYVMKINLSCSTNDKQETFRYSKSTYACVDCSGKTNMTGDNKPSDNNNNNSKPTESVVKTSTYSCTTWSAWSDNKNTDSSLDERTRIVVLGVKKGTTKTEITYSEWSEYTTTPIEASSNREVDMKTVVEKVWSGTKTSSTPVQESSTIKLIGERVIDNSKSSCPSGYTDLGDRCISSSRIKGDLTYSQYSSDEYEVYNQPCEAIHTEYHDGKYVLVYKGCLYKQYVSKKSSGGSTKVYDYQELEDKNVSYYRSREIKTQEVPGSGVFTKDYYEEKYLPEGFVKSSGSEKTQYSYKLKKCEK